MKNKLLATLTFLTLSWPTLAQTTDSVNYQNQLGIIASPQLDKFFTANRSLPVGLIYKRQIKPDQALRFSILGAYKRQTFTSTIGPEGLDRITTSSLHIMPGYEWQQDFTKRWALYYGIDAGIGFNNIIEDDEDTDYRYPNTSGPSHFTKITKDKTVNLSIRPFAGLQYKISRKLYLATETAISATLSRREYNHNIQVILYSSGEEIAGEHGNGIWKEYNLKYSPISNIQLIYNF